MLDSWPLINVYNTDYQHTVVSYSVEGDGPASITYTDEGSPQQVHSWWFNLGPTSIKLPWVGLARGIPSRDSFVVEAVADTPATHLRCGAFNRRMLQEPVLQEGMGHVRCELHPFDHTQPVPQLTVTVPASGTGPLTQTLPLTQTPILTETAPLTQTTPVTKTRVFMP